MRNFLLLVSMLIFCSGPCLAADAAFDAFWLQFKAALSKHDKAAVASMTKLPFLFDSKQLNKEGFIGKYNVLFPASVEACIKKEKPIFDHDSYSVFCGETIYMFAKVKGKYMFTEIGVND